MFEFDLEKAERVVKTIALDELELFLIDCQELVYLIEDCIEIQSKFSDKDFI